MREMFRYNIECKENPLSLFSFSVQFLLSDGKNVDVLINDEVFVINYINSKVVNRLFKREWKINK